MKQLLKTYIALFFWGVFMALDFSGVLSALSSLASAASSVMFIGAGLAVVYTAFRAVVAIHIAIFGGFYYKGRIYQDGQWEQALAEVKRRVDAGELVDYESRRLLGEYEGGKGSGIYLASRKVSRIEEKKAIKEQEKQEKRERVQQRIEEKQAIHESPPEFDFFSGMGDSDYSGSESERYSY